MILLGKDRGKGKEGYECVRMKITEKKEECQDKADDILLVCYGRKKVPERVCDSLSVCVCVYLIS